MHFIGHSTKLLPSANLTLGKEKVTVTVSVPVTAKPLPSAKSTLGNEFLKKYKKTAAAAFPRAARDGSLAHPAR